MWNRRFVSVVMLSVCLAGCSGGGGTTTAVVTPSVTSTQTPDPGPVVAKPTADVLVQHVLARAITAPITRLRFTARDGQNHVLFTTGVVPVQSQILLAQVPVEATELLIEYLDANGNLRGICIAPLALVEGQTFTVDDPSYLDIAQAVTALAVSPVGASLANGTFVQLTATATLEDGTLVDVSSQATWSSSDPSAAVSTKGLVSGLLPGAAVVSASFAGQTAQTDVTVTAATLQKVVVSPPTNTVAAGTSTQFTALAQFSDGTTQDVTPFATWSASGTASVNGTGLATGTLAGNGQIDASFNGQSGQAALTVSAATLVSIDVQPPGIGLTPGANQAFTATGTLSDGSTQNLTGSVAWSSTGNIAGNVFTAGATGGFTVTATQGAVTRTVDVQVTQPAGSGPVLIAGHNRTMFRLVGFSESPGTGQLVPLPGGYPEDSVFMPAAAGTLLNFVPNPAFRTAFIINRLPNSSNATSHLTMNADGTSVNKGVFTTIGADPTLGDWAPDGRIYVSIAQTSRLALGAWSPDGVLTASSLPANLGASINALTVELSGQFAHAATANNLFTVPINKPNVLGAPVSSAIAGLTFLEAGPEGSVLYAIANGNSVSTYSLNNNTGAPTFVSTVALPGAQELLLSQDERWLFALTNSPDEVWVFPVNQSTLQLGAPVGPFAAGTTPTGLCTDPSSAFLYIASSGDDTVVAYAINRATGQLTNVSGSPFATGQTGLRDVMVIP